MALIVNYSRIPGDRTDISTFRGLYGTVGDDTIIHNGTPGWTIRGLGGDDDINPGAVNVNRAGFGETDYVITYGGWAVKQHNKSGGAVGTPKQNATDGHDTMHFGAGIEAHGGSQGDLYVTHGFGSKEFPGRAPNIAPREGDKLVIAHDAGWDITDIEAFRFYTDKDGDKHVVVKGFTIEGYSKGVFAFQNAELGFQDDNRGPASLHVVDLEYAGSHWGDELRAAVKAGMTPGHQAADYVWGVDQWIF